MSAAMTEDEVYRTTTQYRLWSYTAETLASLRSKTNSLAASRVRDAIQRVRLEKGGISGQAEGAQQAENDGEVDCLTVEEEQKLLGFYCGQAMDLSDFCEFPTNVKATAVQYLKRFYLSNSPMTYHPKQMTPSALFLSTKTENHYISLKSFVSKLPKTTADDVVAPEFLLTQGLRFTFDVRHPQRGLEGGFMELLAISTGSHQPPQAFQESAKSLQKEMLALEPVKGFAKARSPADLKTRIQIAHGKAKDILKTSTLLTDVYFLYTPSQIWLAAFMMGDEPLTRFYLRSKFPKPDGVPSQLMSAIEGCVTLLASSPSVKPEGAEAAELARIHKKLYRCRNPEKMDLVGINQAQKRDGEAKGESALDEKIVKKRKLEREQGLKDAESVFGPELAQ